MSRPAPRQVALHAALALSLAATGWVAVHDEADPLPAAPRRTTAQSVRSAASGADWPPPMAASRASWPAASLEARRAWGEPAADAAHGAPALTPTAPPTAAVADAGTDAEATPPPFPYTLVGRLTDGQTRVVLDGPLRSRVAAVGDVIDGQWRIEAIDGTALRVRHLPDGPPQTLSFPSS